MAYRSKMAGMQDALQRIGQIIDEGHTEEMIMIFEDKNIKCIWYQVTNKTKVQSIRL